MITSLIDKQDNFEIIRDQIAGILKSESVSQQALAVTAGKDPEDFAFRVFTERSNPWESFLNESTRQAPLVNVWYDTANFDPKASNVFERQKADGIFNIDCYGLGISTDDPESGHLPGDREAALEAQRAVRMVRNILMASEYTYLGLRGLVWTRWPQSINTFQPQLDARTVHQVIGARVVLRVTYSEFAPQYEPVELELLTVDVKRAEDGEIVLEADYDYTL